MQNKKKRKFKKGFKRFLYIFFLAIIIFAFYLLNKLNVINLNNFYENTKSIFIKENNLNKNLEEINNNDFVTLFKNRLPSKNLEFATNSEISKNGDMKIFLKDTENNKGYLYVNINDEASFVWINFVSVIDVNPLKTKIENDLRNLEYIDLRFSNKVFYKFKENIINISEPKTEEIEDLKIQNFSTSSDLINREMNSTSTN